MALPTGIAGTEQPTSIRRSCGATTLTIMDSADGVSFFGMRSGPLGGGTLVVVIMDFMWSAEALSNQDVVMSGCFRGCQRS